MSTRGASLLIRDARCVVTMDAQRRELADASILVENGRIHAIGPLASMDPQRVASSDSLDARGCVVMPGLVNTHHHMFQSLTRAVRRVQDAELFGWLSGLYPIWQHLTPEMIRVSTELALVELMLSGCTTSSDHLYLYPNGVRIDDQFEAAARIGMRFHACRGSMSLGQSHGGLPPDALVEAEEVILADTRRAIERWHDPGFGSMRQVAVAPCSPFSVGEGLMRASAELARSYRVRLHTHLAESDRDVQYTRERFACTPDQLAESLGWLGPDVWHAHCVKLGPRAIARFARSQTGVAHCPCSNMRLGSGIAPVPAMRDAGLPVGLGVDGSASNDSGSLIAEARQAMLLARVGHGASAMSARDALEMATIGGARVLGRDDIGALELGRCADLAVFDVDGVAFAGAQDDPVAALVFCAPVRARDVIVGGRLRLRHHAPVDLDIAELVHRHTLASRALLRAA